MGVLLRLALACEAVIAVAVVAATTDAGALEQLRQQTAFMAYVSQLQQAGVKFASDLSLDADAASGLRSLVLKEPVGEGQQVFFVPSSAILTVEQSQSEGVAWQTCSAAGLESLAFNSPEHTAIALYLLEQRASGSRWDTWMSLLPQSYEGTPPLYTEEDFSEFQASPVRRILQSDQELVRQDYALAVARSPNLTLADFIWARAVVMSRQFHVQVKHNGQLQQEKVLMVPLLDLVNHPAGEVEMPNVHPKYESELGVSFSATRAISPGQGLYAHYGTSFNREILRRWGFTDPWLVDYSNIPIFLQLLREEEEEDAGAVSAMKKDLVLQNVRDGKISLYDDGSVLHELRGLFSKSGELLGHLRFLAFPLRSVADLKTLQARCTTTICGAMSASNERAALQRLATVLADLEGRYSTTEEEDQKLFDAGQELGSGSQWNALVIRLGEKRTLRKYKFLLSMVDPLFGLSPEELREQIETNLGGRKPHWSSVDEYVNTTVVALVDLQAVTRTGGPVG